MADPSIRFAIASSDLFAVIDPCISKHHLHLVSIPGYCLFHSLRVDAPPLSNRVHGGVLLYVKNSVSTYLTAINLNHGNNYDHLLVRLGDTLFAFVYMVQPQSTIHHRVPVPIWDSLLGELVNLQRSSPSSASATQNLPRPSRLPIIVMGDFNAHTASSTASGASDQYNRHSSDPRTDAYGNELLRFCETLKLQIANGFLEPGEPTFLGDGSRHIPSSVINYLLFSQTLYNSQRIESFKVLPPLLQLNHQPIEAKILVTIPPTRKARRAVSALEYNQIPKAGPPNEANVLLDALVAKCHKSTKRTRMNSHNITPEGRSSAFLRRQMTGLACTPGFRNNMDLLTSYRSLSKERHALQSTARRKIAEANKSKLLACQGKKEYWDFVQSIRGQKTYLNIDPAAAEVHFRKLLQSDSLDGPTPLDDVFEYSPREAVTVLDDPITPDEVKSALKKMKNSADGEDRISVKELRGLDPDQIALFFYEMANTSDGSPPRSWMRSILIPIPKPGANQVGFTDPKSLRGLSVQTSIRQLYSQCLVPRLVEWMDDAGMVPMTQTGFRKGYRTTNNLAILRALHERSLVSKQSLYVAFIDLEKAFDNVDRPSLWHLIHSRGGKGALVDTLRALY